jgi:hypothetical protein
MMAQRASGHPLGPNEDCATPPAVTATIFDYVRTLGLVHGWDSACGDKDALQQALRGAGFTVTSTSDDFLAYHTPPPGVDLVVTNPPYGARKKGELGEAFIRQALAPRAGSKFAG